MNLYKSLIRFPLVLLVLTGSILFAQEKQLTLEDAVYMNREIFPKRMNQLMWMGNTDELSFVENNALVRSSASTDNKRTAVTLDDLNAGEGSVPHGGKRP